MEIAEPMDPRNNCATDKKTFIDVADGPTGRNERAENPKNFSHKSEKIDSRAVEAGRLLKIFFHPVDTQ